MTARKPPAQPRAAVRGPMSEFFKEENAPRTTFGPPAINSQPTTRDTVSNEILEQLQHAIANGEPAAIPLDVTCQRCGGRLIASATQEGTTLSQKDLLSLSGPSGSGCISDGTGVGLSPEAIADLMDIGNTASIVFRVVLICSANREHRYLADQRFVPPSP